MLSRVSRTPGRRSKGSMLLSSVRRMLYRSLSSDGSSSVAPGGANRTTSLSASASASSSRSLVVRQEAAQKVATNALPRLGLEIPHQHL